MNWEKLGFVKYAPLRLEVVKALDKEKTPAEITKELNKSDSNIARVLGELEDKEIVKCLTPNTKRGKFFTLTKDGKEIREKLI